MSSELVVFFFFPGESLIQDPVKLFDNGQVQCLAGMLTQILSNKNYRLDTKNIL